MNTKSGQHPAPQLTPPDSHYLNAAIGWLELGNAKEAEAELARITASFHGHPDVLQVHWQIGAQTKQWEACCELARRMIDIAPRWDFGWIHYSYALHELKRTAEAKENLLKVVDLFPKDWLLRYNLACYETQLGKLDLARHWLHAAIELGDKKQITEMMSDDPDLAPLKKVMNW